MYRMGGVLLFSMNRMSHVDEQDMSSTNNSSKVNRSLPFPSSFPIPVPVPYMLALFLRSDPLDPGSTVSPGSSKMTDEKRSVDLLLLRLTDWME